MVWFRMFIERWKDAQETGDHRRPKNNVLSVAQAGTWGPVTRTTAWKSTLSEHCTADIWHLLNHCWIIAEPLLNHCWIIADRASTCVSVHVTLVTSVLKGDGLITVDLDFYAVYRTTATNSGILWWLPFEKRKMKTWQENACEEVWCC